METLYSLAVRYPRFVLVVVALTTLALGSFAAQIRFDGSVDSLLPADDPGKRYYDGVRGTFGSDEIGVIGIIADDVLSQPTFETITRLTQAIEAIDGVERVLSLANARDPVLDAVEPPLLVPRAPATADEADELRLKLADRPLYLKNLVSADMRAAALNVFFRDMSDDEYLASGIDAKIATAIAAEQGPVEIHYTGLRRFKAYSMETIQRDLGRFVPITILEIVLVLAVGFRSVRGVVLPALTVIVSLAWTLGLMTLGGTGLSLATMALPPLVLVLGTAYSLHIVAAYGELAAPGRDRAAVVLETLRGAGLPLTISALTTVAGFASLGLQSIVSIREMGLYSSLGITIAFVLSILAVPAALMLLPLSPGPRPSEGPSGLGRWLEAMGRFSMGHRWSVLAVALLASIAVIPPIRSIQVDANFLAYFREDDPVRRATDAINRHLVGSMAFYVVVDAAEQGLFRSHDTLRRLKDLQGFIDRVPGVEKTVSFIDYAEMLDRGAQATTTADYDLGPGGVLRPPSVIGGGRTFWQDPSRLGAVLYFVAASPKSFAGVIDADFSRANIVVRTSLSSSSDINAAAARIAEYARQTLPPELVATPTGSLLLFTRTIDGIVAGQVQSLALTATVIFAVMAAMFLSARVGLIAMIPNLFPILLFFGLLGATGAPLNFATSIIASIALGVGVDDTIQIMSRLSSEVRRSANQERAILATLSSVGRPAACSSLLLLIGLATLSFSTFVPIQQFGALAAVTIFAGMAAELALLPALLATTRIITLWDVLNLKLGHDPQRTIPVFATLRATQAKIVALMAELESFQPGEPIVRQGDVGDAMYVIISGRADVCVDVGERSRTIRELGRGDVFGEMGLIRAVERTASVVATQNVEALVLNAQFLARIQRRYPRMATKILLNLARILSDRLQDETRRVTRSA